MGLAELAPPKAALNFIKFEDENEDEDEPRNKEESLTSRTGAGLETSPQFLGHQAEEDDGDLADDEEDQPFERRVRETVAVQADAEHVHAEPREAGDDVADDGEVHQAAFAHEAAPARMQDGRVPEHDEQRAVFLRVPAPEPAPRLVGPDAAQDGADKTEQRGETDDAINHPRQ